MNNFANETIEIITAIQGYTLSCLETLSLFQESSSKV